MRRLPTMLNQNIKSFRKSKGLSQQELAVKLNVVRQTVSKWEQGLSVPDADMLISLSRALDVPVAVLLGDTVEQTPADPLSAISERLEIINLQLAKAKLSRLRLLYRLLICFAAVIFLLFLLLALLQSPYLKWDFNDPEMLVAGTFFHAFEYLYVRISPIFFVGSVVGCTILKRKIRNVEDSL